MGLFTAAGEALARSMVDEVIDGVTADRLTRRQAVEQLWLGLEFVAEADGSPATAEVLQRIIVMVSPAFKQAGYRSITLKEMSSPNIRSHAVRTLGIDHLVTSVGVLNEAWMLVRQEMGGGCVEGSTPPWGEEWAAAYPDADFYLYVAPGPFSGNSRISVLVISPKGEFVFLNDAVSVPGSLAMVLSERALSEQKILLLRALDMAVTCCNVAAAGLNQPGVISIRLHDGALVTFLDGEPYQAASLTTASEA